MQKILMKIIHQIMNQILMKEKKKILLYQMDMYQQKKLQMIQMVKEMRKKDKK